MAPRSEMSWAVVNFQSPGFHRWPGATGLRAYLGQRHRHLFHVTVWVQVFHDEREIEFHDLLDLARFLFPGGEMGDDSCETMARRVGRLLAAAYPRRALRVQVMEDGEVGAEFAVEQF